MESINEKSVFEVAEINLSYKSNVKPSLRPRIECSKGAEKVLGQIWNSDQIIIPSESNFSFADGALVALSQLMIFLCDQKQAVYHLFC